MKIRIKDKSKPFQHPEKFGWGDPHAADCFLNPGAQKANPYHHGAGDERGGEFTTQDDSTILFEAAPDPNNKELTQRWETLTAEEKVQVSNAVVKDIMPDALKELQTAGVLENQFGGYEGYTNPCYALTVDDEHAIPAAKMLGYALSQDSMAVVSDHAITGLDKLGAVVVNLPQAEMNLKALATHYENLAQLTDDSGNMLVGGFNAHDGKMMILNFTDKTDAQLASLVDKQMGGKYNVYTDKLYSTLVEKKDYLSAGNQEAQGRGAAAWRESADRLRQSASQAINGELRRRGKAAVQAVKHFIKRIRRK
jgi:hypothetical protein